ncbi:sigma-54-dependent Fis family transcriptional regulator [Ahniella affigens]|uniref:Sigma-54-dependent Fis family transcriptional regulator n=1 Tax=Ahniella affigens TaxID=2021234 RepID=A0A2P1PVL2_9GAMM|nr:sigma 54-interacting transcriptional regulator [Ahniella affigens]AVP98895.1 sigma-54-dependent Fis family transcriptional regulator [Ahniella affigens]
MSAHDHALTDDTLSAPAHRRRLAKQTCLGLTILWHPDRHRIGAQAALPLDTNTEFTVNRLAPIFHAANRQQSEPLAHRSVSRQPLLFHTQRDGGVRITVPDSRMLVRVQGRMINHQIDLDAAALTQGVVIELGEQLVLCLGTILCIPDREPDLGLIGVSHLMSNIRSLVRQMARSELPVLVLGESGTGKELIARALHASSQRHAHALVSVNMAALSEQLAAADLFGAIKGAYTGATQGRRGFFAEAQGGSLFLDEIGDAPALVQPMLLRALETGEYRPVGASRSEHSTARVIAATDRALADGSFNVPLLRRLEALVIQVPPLRLRREDLGVLVRHVLEQENAVEPSLFDARDLAALALFDWPGNVRQLVHVVRRLLLARRSQMPVTVASVLADLPKPQRLSATAAPTPHAVNEPAVESTKGRSYRDPRSVDDAALCASLAACGWCVRDAAEQLGVSRTSFYALLQKSKLVRQPAQIPTDELRAVMRQFPDQLDAWAAALKTPKESLRRFVQQLPREH